MSTPGHQPRESGAGHEFMTPEKDTRFETLVEGDRGENDESNKKGGSKN